MCAVCSEAVLVDDPAASIQRLRVVEGVFDGLEDTCAHALVEAENRVIEAPVRPTECTVFLDGEIGARVVARDAGVADDGTRAGVEERVERSRDEELGELELTRPAQIVAEALATERRDHANADEESRVSTLVVDAVVPAVARKLIPARERRRIAVPVEEEGVLRPGGRSTYRGEADSRGEGLDASGELGRVGADVLAFACPGEALDFGERVEIHSGRRAEACMKSHSSFAFRCLSI